MIVSSSGSGSGSVNPRIVYGNLLMGMEGFDSGDVVLCWFEWLKKKEGRRKERETLMVSMQTPCVVEVFQ